MLNNIIHTSITTIITTIFTFVILANNSSCHHHVMYIQVHIVQLVASPTARMISRDRIWIEIYHKMYTNKTDSSIYICVCN